MIRFYFDYVSPYAYLASTQIRALGRKHGQEVLAEPVLFAGLLAASGGQGPAEIPLKRDYLWQDCVRLAAWLDVPFAPPASHPFNPLAALRTTLAVTDPGERWRLVEALFRAAWVDARPLADAAEVKAVVAAVGLDAEACMARAVEPDVKDRLRTDTEAASAAKVFGVPSMTVDGQLFWGVDSLGLLERYLSGADRPDAEILARFQALAPTAMRRR